MNLLTYSILFYIREPFLPIKGSMHFRIDHIARTLSQIPKVFIVPRNQNAQLIVRKYSSSKVFKTLTPIPRFPNKSKLMLVTLFGMETLFKMNKIIKENNVKTIYSFGPLASISAYYSKLETPYIIDLCETDLPYVKLSMHRSLSKIIGIPTEKFILHTMTEINSKLVVLSKAMMKYLSKQGFDKNRIIVAYDGTDPKLFNIIDPSEKKEYSIVFTGDISERDGVDLLIKAFSLITKEISKAKLYIIGEGPALRKIKRLTEKIGINRNIVFTGWISFSRLVKILPTFYIGVAPLKPVLINDLIIPRKVFEFTAAGVPVVASNLSAIREVIKNNTTGLLFKPNDEEDLAEKILKLIDDENLYRRIQSNALKIANTYSVYNETNKIINELLNMYLS